MTLRASCTGDWNNQDYRRYADYVFKGTALVCDYSYRNMPVITWYGQVAGTRQYKVKIKGTRPEVTAEVACPAFKTQRILGGRAIVSDALAAA